MPILILFIFIFILMIFFVIFVSYFLVTLISVAVNISHNHLLFLSFMNLMKNSMDPLTITIFIIEISLMNLYSILANFINSKIKTSYLVKDQA
jgi:hypothetical protein